MPNILNRTTKQYLLSVSESDYSTVDWIENPDLSAVDQGGGVLWPNRYWTISGDTVGLMNPAQRNAVDAQLLEDARDATTNELDGTETLLRAFALAVLDEINGLRALHSLSDRTIAQMKTAIRNKLGT